MRYTKDVKCEVCGKYFLYEIKKPSRPAKRACSKECSYALRVSARKQQHSPVEKNCIDCEESFFDTSKKKLVDRCSSCISCKMVSTRRSRGSYDRTQVQNEKLSKTLRKKYNEDGYVYPDGARVVLSQKFKDRWASGEMKEKTEKTCFMKYGVSHWTRTESAKKRLSDIRKSYMITDATREKMSISATRRVRKHERHFSRGNGGFRDDIGHYVRSNWEANFARILLTAEIPYVYEPETFSLCEGVTYTPDFKVANVFFEIKGYMNEISGRKIALFREKFNDIPLVIIDGAVYDLLRTLFREKIKWEGR